MARRPSGTQPAEPVAPEQPPSRASTEATAIGLLMVGTTCTVGSARRVLAVAARSADATVGETAQAVVDRSGGHPLPSRIDRALRTAVAAARTPATRQPPGLRPAQEYVAELLSRFRVRQARLRREPGDVHAQEALDDIAYTLCVLTGTRTLRDALRAAEERLSEPYPDGNA
ncbi:DUF5133 domain-containing protein [Streptomyces sp. Da 82-17]|uniref:DUF5133 domain-containing protein n=1 Tax=Streptomyces sp. Da 82-17 TaxID=3377116 RepID=UPI0038D3C4DB